MAQTIKPDYTLFITTLCLVAAGLAMTISASPVMADQRYGTPFYFILRQVGWIVGALGIMWFLKKKDYRKLNKTPLVFTGMAAVLVLLLAVYFLDPRFHRWMRFGPVSLQPSEFAKPALIIFLAHLAARRASVINNRHTLLCAAAIVGLVAGAVIVADLGTAVVIAITAAVMFLVAGIEWRFLAIAALVMTVVVSAAIFLKPYRLARVFSLIDPEYKILDSRPVRAIDPEGKLKAWCRRMAPTRDSNYHVKQSLIAVGSGGPLGVGYLNSRQKLFYLPEAHTDFVYAVLAEEFGLVGSTLVLVAFIVIGWRGFRIHFRAPDDFGRLVALGVTTAVVVQAFLNMSVVLGMIPPKGIPLPMLSYGGSSLASTLILLGVLQSVGEHTG